MCSFYLQLWKVDSGSFLLHSRSSSINRWDDDQTCLILVSFTWELSRTKRLEGGASALSYKDGWRPSVTHLQLNVSLCSIWKKDLDRPSSLWTWWGIPMMVVLLTLFLLPSDLFTGLEGLNVEPERQRKLFLAVARFGSCFACPCFKVSSGKTLNFTLFLVAST